MVTTLVKEKQHFFSLWGLVALETRMEENLLILCNGIRTQSQAHANDTKIVQ